MKEKLKEVIKELNQQQQKALFKTINGGHIVVLAVPGSGKTKTIASTVATMVATGTNPNNILVLTFTKKAAHELKERIETMLENFEILSRVNVYTFHSLALRMIKKLGTLYIEKLGESVMIDEGKQKRLFNVIYEKTIQELEENNYFSDNSQREMLKKDIAEKRDEIFGIIKRNKTFDISVYKFQEQKKITNSTLDILDINHLVYLFWERYENIKTSRNELDFDDILILFKEMLKNIPEFRESVKSKFTHILVDEFQDTSSQQIEIINLIKSDNLAVVGDDSQTIYSWRNADINNIKNFKDDYSAVMVSMETNYRSNEKIVGLANSIIEFNKNRVKKEIKPLKQSDETNEIRLEIFNTDVEEANYVAEKVLKGNLGTTAILYRNHKVASTVEHVFKEKGILFNKKGVTDIFSDWEISTAIEYLNVYINDSEQNLLKLMISAKGIGKVTAEKVKQIAYTEKISIVEAAKREKRSKEFGEKMDEYFKLKTLEELFNHIEKYFIVLEEDKRGTLKGFRKLMIEYLNNDLLNIKEDTFEKMKTKIVNMMTIHSSKGLEFDTVFLIGFEEGVFPSMASIMQGQIEEERRLCFVAITRARDNLILTSSRKRGEKSYNLSSFLAEIKGIDLGPLEILETKRTKSQEELKSCLADMAEELGVFK